MTAEDLEPFHTLDHLGNEYVIEHGDVSIDGPTTVTLWPLSLWRSERDQGGGECADKQGARPRDDR